MTVSTALCQCTADDVRLRGKSLPHELIGQVSFTHLLWWQLLGRTPSPGQVAVLDACLVTLMEHGLTPTAVTARLTYTSAPEAMQGAVAAGLLSVGSLFAGSSEACAALLTRIAAADDPVAEAAAVRDEARAARRRLPGFGHPVHKPVDPRVAPLLAVAEKHGLYGAHCAALAALSAAVDAQASNPVPVNATGAIAALLLDAGLPASMARGIALVSRCAGLVAHIHEEQQHPAFYALWEGAEGAVPYAAPAEEDR